ncbi:MAG: hypothetical protein AAFZ17_20585 [Cyanobacteria bacterium J06650_10]
MPINIYKHISGPHPDGQQLTLKSQNSAQLLSHQHIVLVPAQAQ